ncbi:MAG TPA: TIGR04282 family arsenosugar biosynthesis glycosyltransferase [Planctomycetaceae bacterium]|nr:TIGR04282 family arsenosugar biosynthesis glycosyltransferase [Planctomycetaceae bacterium]
MTSTFGMFVKFPQPGRVKSRLATAIGETPAARLYEAFLRDLIHRFRRSGTRRVLAFTPDTAEACEFFRGLAGEDYELWPQPDGPLGSRLQAFFESFGPEPVVLIGSDSPTVPTSLVDLAESRLIGNDAVLGPAMDGGVWLIGLNQQRDATRESKLWTIFEGIEWSTPRVLEQLAGRLAELKARFCLLPPWFDVDEPDDLQVLRGQLWGWRWSQDRQADCFPATMAVLDDFERRSTV